MTAAEAVASEAPPITQPATPRRMNWAIVAVAAITVLYTLITFGYYYERTLNGNINNHILAAEMFGTPEKLVAKGIKPVYYGPTQSGWDGQFYYYMSNDILGVGDTPQHIDTPPYRYQRVGLSLLANIVAKVTLQDWVSPFTYFMTYFVLILAATIAGGSLLARMRIHPAFILLWSLNVGTQVTLFSALPDASADAFLILGLRAAYSKRWLLSALPFVFSGLSREVYVLFPSFMFLFLAGGPALASFRAKTFSIPAAIKTARPYWPLLLPGAVAVIWLLYVTTHFGASPGAKASDVLGLPFVTWLQYFISGLQGAHIFVGANWTAYAEAFSLAGFMAVLGIALWLAIRALRSKTTSPEMRGIALAMVAFVALYVCFAPVVIKHYTGYLKALAVFFVLIPILLAALNASRRTWLLSSTVLLATLIVPTYYNMQVRILPFASGDDQYTRMSAITETKPVACFTNFSAQVKVKDVQVMQDGALSAVFGAGPRMLVTVDLTNPGPNDFVSTLGGGTVHMSYQWVDAAGKVKVDGVRTAIPETIHPGETRELRVISLLPRRRDGDLTMKISPVQEGCAWFYVFDPAVTQSQGLQIRN